MRDSPAERARNKRTKPKRTNRLDGISFEFAPEAREVLNKLINLQEEYGAVSISDYLEEAGLHENIEPIDTVKGWRENIRRAKVKRTKDNDYVIEFPRAENISE